MTSGETDRMDKHHAADCQDPEDAAATSDPFGGNKVNLGVNTITEFSQDERVSGLLGCEWWKGDTHVFCVWLFEMFYL